MKIGVALIVFAVGAILTFAVRVSTPVLNLQIVGVILMLTAIVGAYLSRRGSAWVRKHIVIRRRRRPAQNVEEIDEVLYPPYVKENPGALPGAVVEPVVEPGDTTMGKFVADRISEYE